MYHRKAVKKQEKILRAFLWFYPVFLLVLFSYWLISYHQLSSASHRVEELTEEVERRAEEIKSRWGDEEDIQRLNRIVGKWNEMTGLAEAEVPVLIEEAARNTGCKLVDYKSNEQVSKEGYEFETADLTVEGTFSEITGFMLALERHPRRFVRIPEISIRPGFGENTDKLDVRLGVEVLLRKIE